MKLIDKILIWLGIRKKAQPGIKFGWKRDLPDHRDFKFKVSAPVELPPLVDLRDQCPPVYNQLDIGSCVGNGVAGAYQFEEMKQGKENFIPSRLFIYYNARALEGSCLVGSTKISLLNGNEVTISDLYENKTTNFWVYGCDTGKKIIPTMAESVIYKGKRKCITVILDNGESITCTPEHLFMMRNGEYKEAQNLVINDSLMPLYKMNEKGYEKVFTPRLGKYIWTHRLVYRSVHPESVNLLNNKDINYVIHHKDFDKINNAPDNLELLTRENHARLHSKLLTEYTRTPEGREQSAEKFRKLWRNEQYREMMTDICKINMKKLREKIDSGKVVIDHKTDKVIRGASESLKKLWLNEEFRSKKCKEASETTKKRWEDPIIREFLSSKIKKSLSDPDIRKKISENGVMNWKNPEYRSKIMPQIKENAKKRSQTLEFKEWASDTLSNNWKNDDFRNKEITMLVESWKNDETRTKRVEGMKKAWQDDEKRKIRIENIKKGKEKNKLNIVNHKVIQVIDADECDVFDIINTGTNNFALSSGVFVHNCYEDSGCSIRNGIKTAVSDGVCPETMWPYKTCKFKTKPTSDCYKAALDNQVLQYQRITPHNLYDVKQCLALGYPIICGISLYESFMTEETARTGIVKMPNPNESLVGGHCIVIVGYNDNNQSLIVRNSWGNGWGMKGYFFLPYGYVSEPSLSADYWTIRLVE